MEQNFLRRALIPAAQSNCKIQLSSHHLLLGAFYPITLDYCYSRGSSCSHSSLASPKRSPWDGHSGPQKDACTSGHFSCGCEDDFKIVGYYGWQRKNWSRCVKSPCLVSANSLSWHFPPNWVSRWPEPGKLWLSSGGSSGQRESENEQPLPSASLPPLAGF